MKECFLDLTKEVLYVSKTILVTGMLQTLYDSLFEKPLGGTFALVSYGKTTFSSINFMFKRVLRVKKVLFSMNMAQITVSECLDLDPSISMPKSMTSILSSYSL